MNLHPRLNIFCGENGSGKTSILEAMYLLGTGKSFRAHKLEKLIQRGQHTAIVYGTLKTEAGAIRELAIQKESKSTLINIAGHVGESLGQLARELPILAITPESHALIEEGPEVRRRYLDWGVFHVEPGYNEHWQRYMRALKQRNALLKQARATTFESMDAPWRHALAEEGEQVHALRAWYLEKLRPVFSELAVELLMDIENIALRLSKGWPESASLEAALNDGIERDIKYQATQSGPHRADILIEDSDGSVQTRVSRGQQKLLVYALRLAQIKLLIEYRQVYPVVLLDDLPAELDEKNLARVMGLLAAFGCQVMVTAIRPDAWAKGDIDFGKLFHVEQGCVSTAAC